MGGFEPPSPAPKAGMIDHYTTLLYTILYTGITFKHFDPNLQCHSQKLIFSTPSLY